MKNSLSRVAGLTLLGTALAGAGEAQAADRMTHDVYEVLGGKSTLMNPKFTPANGRLSDLNTDTLENAFFLEPFGVWSDMAEALEAHTDDLLMIQSGPSYTEYNLYSYEGKAEGKPLFRFAGAEDICDSLPQDVYTGYYEINGRRFYVLPDQTGTSSGACPAELAAVTTSANQTAAAVLASNELPIDSVHPLPPPSVTGPDRLSGEGNFSQVDPALFQGAKFLLEKEEKVKKGAQPGYETLTFIDFDSTGGRLRAAFSSNSSFAGQCVVAIDYENVIYDAAGVPSFVFHPDFRTSKKPCVEAPVAAVVKNEAQKEEAHPLSLAPLAPSRINVWGMADLEDTYLPYSEGVAPGVTASAEWMPLRKGTVLPGLTIGVSANAIFSGEGSGMEGVQGTLGYRSGRVGVSGLAGMSFEPRVPGSALNNAPSVGLMATVDVLKLPAGFQVTGFAQVEQQFFGQDLGTFNGSVGGGFTYKIDVQAPERAPHEPRVEAPVVPHLTTSTRAFEGDALAVSSFKVPSEGDQAEHIRLSEEMRLGASNNTWKRVETNYQLIVKLGVEPTYNDYMKAANAARALGDMSECYVRVRRAAKLNPTKEAMDWIAAIETNYGSIVLQVEKDYKGDTTLVPTDPPFAPDERFALTTAQKTLEETRGFEGLLPTSTTFTFGGEPVTVTSLGAAEEGKVRQTEVITLED